MAFDVNRWLKYAKARIDSAVGEGNRSLDRLEAERQAEVADKPWLRSDRAAPTLDEARARIEWEAEQQHRSAEGPASPTAPGEGHGTASPPAATRDARARGPQATTAADAEHESARLELERREQASADRLEQIRRELGVEDPPSGGPPEDGRG